MWCHLSTVSRSAVRTTAWLVALVALPGVASAQGVDEFGPYGPIGDAREPTPQRVAAEFRVGPYWPKVDNEFNGGASPYRDVFGDSTHWAVGIEVDWQALRLWEFASLGIGGAVHYTAINGVTFDDSGQAIEGNRSKLQIVPMHAVAVLRFDYLVRQTQVPLAFYGKGGLGWAFWASSDSVRDSEYEGVNGSGASLGPLFAVGAMFLLDPIERKQARVLDEQWGINHSYVFFELLTSQLGEGFDDQMLLGTDSWLLGVALEI